MRHLRLLAAFPLLLAACYAPPILPGAQQCSDDGRCPEGFKCFPDKRCYPPDANPTCADKCIGATPVCDKTTLKCVGCLGDGDCPAGYVCAVNVKLCKPGCNARHPGCAADAGSCDVDLGMCRGCLSDAECTDQANPRCDATNGRCVPCLPANDNCPEGQFCDDGNGRFTCASGCKDKAGCPATDGGGEVECCKHACVDVRSDLENCGACGTACPMGNTCCGGACADTANDPANCGGCGAACNPQNASGVKCDAGRCDYAQCNPGFADCDGNRANGCEANTRTDAKNCGACGTACSAPPNGTAVCVNSVCAVGACMPGFADCNNSFKDGCEIDTRTNVANCGACGKSCPAIPNGTPTCVAGSCTGVCGAQPGFANCDGNFANGCETNTNTDPKNCGMCTRACSFLNAGATCAAGSCALGACNAGFGNCNNLPGDGCEANLTADPANCGACAKACAFPNAAASCANSACAMGACNMGFGNCNMLPADGCEAALATNAQNCGSCGRVCSFPNAAASCAAGSCVLGACNAGFNNCDGAATNGCEINTNTDIANCGACAKPCTVANGTPACNAGSCTVAACNANFGNCDGAVANGCETGLSANWKNCRACGTVCANNQACINGTCTTVGTLVGTLGTTRFYKVAVNGAMTDTNVFNACKAVGLNVGCQAMGNCNYNDMLCTQTPEASCGNPMMTLSMALCGTSPPQCAALYGVYQYMGHTWNNDSACGALANNWCVTGNTQMNQFALCVQVGSP